MHLESRDSKVIFGIYLQGDKMQNYLQPILRTLVDNKIDGVNMKKSLIKSKFSSAFSNIDASCGTGKPQH